MPFITVSGGLTLKVPTRGTTDWNDEFLSDFAQKISDHDHSGAGNGTQLGAAAFADDSISDAKILLRNDNPLRARNAASLPTDLLKLNASDILEILNEVQINENVTLKKDVRSEQSYVLDNNQTILTQIGSISFSDSEAAICSYKIKREGTADLNEQGKIYIYKEGAAYHYIQSRSPQSAGVDLVIDEVTGELQYTSTNNPGSTSNRIYVDIKRLGD